MEHYPASKRQAQIRAEPLRDERVAASAKAGTARRGRAAGRHVMMLGLRGIPDIQGGVEKHVEMLSVELVKLGWDVEVVARRPYLSETAPREWHGVRVTPLWSPRQVALEALLHTLAGVGLAAFRRPDIVHIHAVGPSLAVPFARLAGLRVVVTHHGYDYDRQKWGRFAKFMLRLGERFGMRFSTRCIGISEDIVQTMGERYHVPMARIPNGVSVDRAPGRGEVLAEFGLEPKRYVLLAARIVPEKRQADLIHAFARLNDKGVKLVLAGNAEYESPYSAEVGRLARDVPGVVMTGFQSGARLDELFSNAGLFVLPSSHEGMPIVLLEAMAHGLPVLASDIPANLAIGLEPDDYFRLGDIDALALAIDRKLANPPTQAEVAEQIRQTEERYSWRRIAEQTADVYADALGREPERRTIDRS